MRNITYSAGRAALSTGRAVRVPLLAYKPRRALRRGRVVYVTRTPSAGGSPHPAGATHSAVESFWNPDL